LHLIVSFVLRLCQVLGDGVQSKYSEIQELNFTASELVKGSTADQAAAIREPLSDISRRWETLNQNIATKVVRNIILKCNFQHIIT